MSTMTPSIEQLLDTILALPASERAVIADAVMNSLEPPDPEIERAWAEEAQSRFEAYKAGKLESISLEDVFNSREKS